MKALFRCLAIAVLVCAAGRMTTAPVAASAQRCDLVTFGPYFGHKDYGPGDATGEALLNCYNDASSCETACQENAYGNCSTYVNTSNATVDCWTDLVCTVRNIGSFLAFASLTRAL